MGENESRHILFLLGAGASVPMGIPAMRQFTKEFTTYAERRENRKSLAYPLRELKKVSEIRAWDLETMLLLVRQARSIKTDAAVHLLTKKLFRSRSKPKKKFEGKITKVESQFTLIERALLKFIRERCLKPDLVVAKGIYSKLLQLAKKHKLEIFTTNYDSVIEDVCTDLDYDFSDGFRLDNIIGKFLWDPDYLGDRNINIYKLHGSVTWYKKDNNIFKFSEDLIGAPGIDSLMVYPTESKQIFSPPYSDLHRAFEKILFESKMCIAIGHTFRDEYIRNLFIERLKQKKFKMYFICGKYSKSIKKRIFGSTKMVKTIAKNFEEVDVLSLAKYV